MAEVPVREGHAVYDGGCAVGGVPGKGAQILLNFRDCQVALPVISSRAGPLATLSPRQRGSSKSPS